MCHEKDNGCCSSLYDSAAQLERALNALTYAATECREAMVSSRCKTALKDVGLK